MTTLSPATTIRVYGLPYGTDDIRWAAVQARDVQADGHFVYGVRTTGVYCRPSASSRLPRRENIEFFDSAEAAEAAGYRASQRMAADQTAASAHRASLVAQACRRIEQAENPPALEALADGAGLSPWHFHRVFKAETGLTPKAYANAARARRLRDDLLSAATVTDAIYEAGFNASSRFYEQSDALLGMSPRDWRGGGANANIRFAVGQCSLGAILVAQSVRGVCAISLGDDADQLVRELQDRFPRAQLTGAEPEFDQLVAKVVGFVEQPALGLDLPLDVRGTAFQQRVWQALQQIPAGETATYTEIAERIGAPKAVRAVGQACGANPVAVAIPCHRVVRRDGDLSGYRWGIDRKRALLLREQSQADG